MTIDLLDILLLLALAMVLLRIYRLRRALDEALRGWHEALDLAEQQGTLVDQQQDWINQLIAANRELPSLPPDGLRTTDRMN
jgi:hypothetical protein